MLLISSLYRYYYLYPLLGKYNIMYLVFRLHSENSMDYNFWKFDNAEIFIVFGFHVMSAA